MPSSASTGLNIATLLTGSYANLLLLLVLSNAPTLLSSAVFARVLVKTPGGTTLAGLSASGTPGSGIAARKLPLSFAPTLSGMLVSSHLCLAHSALCTLDPTLTSPFTARKNITSRALRTLPGLPNILSVSPLMTLHLFRHAVGQFRRRIARILTLALLGNVISHLLFLVLILYPIPTVIDFVGAD